MAYHSYENLEVWRKSVDLSVNVYKALKRCSDRGLKDQVQRAAVSIASNIAEGMERESKKETMHFLHIAKGSCAEVRTQLIISQRVGYISHDELKTLSLAAESVSRMLHALAVSLKPNT